MNTSASKIPKYHHCRVFRSRSSTGYWSFKFSLSRNSTCSTITILSLISYSKKQTNNFILFVGAKLAVLQQFFRRYPIENIRQKFLSMVQVPILQRIEMRLPSRRSNTFKYRSYVEQGKKDFYLTVKVFFKMLLRCYKICLSIILKLYDRWYFIIIVKRKN